MDAKDNGVQHLAYRTNAYFKCPGLMATWIAAGTQVYYVRKTDTVRRIPAQRQVSGNLERVALAFHANATSVCFRALGQGTAFNSVCLRL